VCRVSSDLQQRSWQVGVVTLENCNIGGARRVPSSDVQYETPKLYWYLYPAMAFLKTLIL
jgi:hypothetical protein